MKSSARSAIIRRLVDHDFTKGAGGVFKQSSEIVIIFDPGTSRKNGLFSVSAGIWIRDMQPGFPKRFWDSNIYGGAGCLFPTLR